MNALPKRYFTVEEYLLLEERSPYKSQWVAGEIFPMGEGTGGDPRNMGGAQPDHVSITDNIRGMFYVRLRGRACHAYANDMRVASRPGELHAYPDVSALCGEPKFDTAQNPPALLNPQVIFEVLSPSTAGFDRGEKFMRYQQIESLTDYVLVTVERMHVDHYVRQPGDRWLLTSYTRPEQNLALPGIGCELPLAEIYERVTFPPPFSDPRTTGLFSAL